MSERLQYGNRAMFGRIVSESRNQRRLIVELEKARQGKNRVTLRGDTDDANGRPSESKSPCHDLVALYHAPLASCDPATSALVRDDSSQSKLEESAASVVR